MQLFDLPRGSADTGQGGVRLAGSAVQRRDAAVAQDGVQYCSTAVHYCSTVVLWYCAEQWAAALARLGSKGVRCPALAADVCNGMGGRLAGVGFPKCHPQRAATKLQGGHVSGNPANKMGWVGSCWAYR
jgi:hypothetical protein